MLSFMTQEQFEYYKVKVLEMASQLMMNVPCLLAPVRDNAVKHVAYVGCIDEKASSSRYCFRMMGGHSIPSRFSEGRHFINAIARASKYRSDITSGGVNKKGRGESSEKNSSDSETEDDDEDDFMDRDKRLEWRTKIREVLSKMPDTEEELDPAEKQKKMQKLLADYPLVVEEDDPDWPDDADGWGFNFDQFFNKITIKNEKNEDDEDYDSDNEIVWQDDNYIRPIKDVKTADWEVTLFKDISPLIVLVHNRYKRPKENERMRDELEKAIHIIWNCRLPSPRCIAVDAVVELNLISALEVSVFPELIFTKAGKILYREKAIRSADELSKIMAFFYYGAAKPSFLNVNEDSQEAVPSVALDTAN